ncbi:MAG: DUF4197 domain-containing protein [Aquabacterium sp.]
MAVTVGEALPRDGWAATVSQGDASTALRATLERGAQIAVQQLGAADGFLNNDKVRIRLPEMLEQATPVLRTIGRGQQLDDLVTAMNHAAERAVSQAFPLLKQTIRGVTPQDALRILQGGENAVTDYFSEKTRAGLTQTFQPTVSKAVDRLSLARQYNDLAGKASRLGLIRGPAVSVQEHVTARALDGLYFVIGEEERRIRRDPAGTGIAILKKVFSAL